MVKKKSSKTGQNYLKIGNLKIKKKVAIIASCALVLIMFIWFMNSSFWPWPSSAEIGRRLNDVIDVCMYNERSRGCSTTQEKYHMSFEYCHSLADIPEIDKKVPVYGVAKKNDIKTREISYRGGDKTYNKYPYYSCTSYLEDVDKGSGTNLLSSEPSTMALFALYKTPQYSTTGDLYKCSVNTEPGYNFLWNQIPNIKTIKNDYKVAFNTHNKCSQLSELQNELNAINAKLSSYSSNRIVQQFYKNYDDWAGIADGGSLYSYNFMEKRFGSRICQDDPESGLEERNSVNVFVNEMRSYTSTDDFTSKIVIE